MSSLRPLNLKQNQKKFGKVSMSSKKPKKKIAIFEENKITLKIFEIQEYSWSDTSCCKTIPLRENWINS